MNKIVADVVNPERSFMRKQWNSIGSPLLKSILGTSEKYGSVVSMSFRIIGTLQGLYALQAIMDTVRNEVMKKLSEIDEDTLTMNLLLKHHANVDKEEAGVISRKLVSLGIDFACIAELVTNLNEPMTKYNDLKDIIGQYEKTNKGVSSFLNSFLDKFMEKESFEQTLDLIIKTVTDKMTEQILLIIDGQFVSPWSTLMTSKVTDALSQRIQHHCLVNKNQNTDSMDEDQKR